MKKSLMRKVFPLVLALPMLQFATMENGWASSKQKNSPTYDPKQAHGVWDRTNHYDLNEQGECIKSDKPPADQSIFKGFRVSPKWSEFEPEEGNYKWCLLDQAIEEAVATNKYIYFQLLVGPDSPEWIYTEKNIPKVEIKPESLGEDKEAKSYPFYAHNVGADSTDGYKDYLTNTINAIANRISTRWNREQVKRLLFIQVATGSTGDETPYKGDPQDARYILEDNGDPNCEQGWCQYRMAIFQAYVEAFQPDSKALKVPLLFNVIDEPVYPTEYNYVMDNVRFLGQKGGVLPRGYHLNGMVNNINEVRPFGIDPQNGFILSRAEMDQTWKNPYFQLNMPMNMYWSVLNALHGGLSVFDISKDLLNPIENPHANKTEEILGFFNKYAGEIYPESSNSAFIAFHKGLDAADKEAYPMDEFCPATVTKCKKQDKNRFQEIVNKYAKFGAKMDDLDGAMLGQVKQRKKLTGFNDSGVDIPSGNFERFITQINPDQHDVGRWRIGGDIGPNTPKESRFARSFWDNIDGETKDQIDLDVNDQFYSLQNGGRPQPMMVHVTYFDEGTGKFRVKYDAVNDPNKRAGAVTKTNTLKWCRQSFVIEDAAFMIEPNPKAGPDAPNEAQDISPDISLVKVDNENSTFHMVEIDKISGAVPADISSEPNCNL